MVKCDNKDLPAAIIITASLLAAKLTYYLHEHLRDVDCVNLQMILLYRSEREEHEDDDKTGIFHDPDEDNHSEDEDEDVDDKMWLLLLCMVTYINAELKNVVVIQSFNLRTTSKINMTCSNIKKIFIENTPVTNYNCAGTIDDANDHGMWIIIETQPVSLKDKKLTWMIEHANENITSSFTVGSTMDKPLTKSTNITVNASAKEQTGGAPSSKGTASTSTTASTSPTTSKATTTEKITTTVTEAKTTKEPTPTSYLITITIAYIQFQMGQIPVNVNKNTQAVVVAVIEGLLLVAILVVFLYKYYKKSKLMAAGQYPSPDVFQTDNHAYYDNGGVLSYGNRRELNTRPQIPSYRTPDTQPAVRLDPLQPVPQQQVYAPTLMPISTSSTTDPQAPLNHWPDQRQQQPVKNIMDGDI